MTTKQRVTGTSPRSILTYLYVLVAVSILVSGTVAGALFYHRVEVQRIEHQANEYHLATRLDVSRIESELNAIALTLAKSRGDDATASDRQELTRSAYIIGRRMQSIETTQRQFEYADFELTTQRLAIAIENLDEAIARHGSDPANSALDALDFARVRCEQLRQLHASAFRDNQARSLQLSAPSRFARWMSILIGSGGLSILLLLGFARRAIRRHEQAEGSLRQRDQAFRTAVTPIAFADLEGRITEANQAFANLFGFESTEQVIGQLNTGFHSEPISVAQINKRIIEGGGFCGEFTSKKADGTPMEIQLTATLFADEDGRPIGSIATFMDVTPWRQVERALRASEELYRTLIEVAPEAIAVFDVEEVRFVDVNENMMKLFRLQREQLLEMGPIELSPKHQPDGRESAQTIMEFAQRALEGEVQTFEWVHLDSEKSEIVCEVRLVHLSHRLLRSSAIDIGERKRAENALSRAESIQRSIMESSLDSIMLLDPQENIQYINRPAPGLTRDQVINTPICHYVAEEFHPRMRDCFRNVLKTGQPDGFQVEYQLDDGTTTYWDSRVAPVLTDNRVTGLTVIARDETVRIEAETRLRESEARFRAIFNSTFQFIGVLDADGILLEANETALAFGGLQPEDVLNRPFWEALWWRGDDARVQQLRDAVRRAATGEFVRYTVDVAGASSVETVDFSLKPVLDDEGKVRLLLPEGRVITEQKRAEAALRASEARFRRLVEHAPEAVVMMDVETECFTMVNAAAERLYQLSATELYERGPIDMSPSTQPDGSPSAERAREYIARACAGMEPVFEWTHRDATGQDIPCEIRLLSLEVDGQTVIRGSITDISERKRVEELIQRQHELVAEELDKAKREIVLKTRLAAVGQMSAQIAHEMRNPLGAISNAIYYLKRRVPAGEEKWRDYLSLMDGELATCNQFIGDLLDVTRARTPKQKTTSLSDLIDRVVARHDVPKSVELQVICQPDPFEIFADNDQIVQVIDNLLQNSLDAIRDQAGRIEICAHRDGEYDIISVHDTGSGILPEYAAFVFDVLFTTKPTGTGLGLAICKQIVEGHGGMIELIDESSPGTKLQVRLPHRHAVA